MAHLNQPPVLQLLDFADYPYYLVPGQTQLVAKDGPIPAGYQVVKTDVVRLQFYGLQMIPTIPAGSILGGTVLPLGGLENLPPGVYSLHLLNPACSQLTQHLLGRLKSQPVKGKLTLWPDNPSFKKTVVSLAAIGLLVRIRAYELLETD